MLVARQAIHLKYPDGPKDAETLMIDPIQKSMYIISKRNDTVGIYSAPLNFNDGETIALVKKGSLYLEGSGPGKYIVSGDISADGRQILIKRQDKVYHWDREKNETIERTLHKQPVEFPYFSERQGEAICFATDGNAYYTVSEGKFAEVFQYPKPGNKKQK
jgi:hypothetical protein